VCLRAALNMNNMEGQGAPEVPVVRFEDVEKSLQYGHLVLDVRNEDEVMERGRITGAMWIPIAELETAMSLDDAAFKEQYGFPKPYIGAPITTHCQGGGRARRAAEYLRSVGFINAKLYKGSFNDWVANKGEVSFE